MGKRSKKDLNKWHYSKMTWTLIRMFLSVLRVLPIKLLYWLGSSITHLAFRVMKKRREITMENLNLAFEGEKSQDEILHIYGSTLQNISKFVMECAAITKFNEPFYENMVSIDGRENLDKALNHGRGVIAVSAHFGNFAFLGLKLIQMGYPFSIIVRYPRQKGLASFYDSESKKLGATLISDKPRGACVEHCLDFLHGNGIVFVLLDLNVSSGGVYVDFFGKMVPTFRGPLTLHAESGAPILPMFAVRENKNRHRIIIERPVEVQKSDDMDHDMFTNLSQISHVMESYIRRYPDQWWWIHQRWRKAKPKE